MTTFRNYWLSNYKENLPEKEIRGDWFAERGLPMIVECCQCCMTMALPCAWIDDDGYCYCDTCAGAEND